MRTASFFILSLALHIGTLLHPVSFRDRIEEQFFRVTIRPMEPERARALARSDPGRSKSTVAPEPGAITPPPPTAIGAPANQPEPPSPFEPAATTGESAALVGKFAPPANTTSAPVHGLEGSLSPTNGHAPGDGGRAEGADQGFGASYAYRSGHGYVEGGNFSIQARYRETPSPSYPESARREGREGRVLLRVLIDVHGRAKTVEINSSSGTEVLDQAAAEAITRWRFHPARYGDEPIESWIRIPVEFRLASAKP